MSFDPFGVFGLFKKAPEPLPSDLPDVPASAVPNLGEPDQTPEADLDPGVDD